MLFLCITTSCNAGTSTAQNELIRLVKLSIKGDVSSFQQEYSKYKHKGMSQQENQPPLIWLVAKYGTADILDFLIKNGVVPDSTNTRSKQTPWPTPLFAAVTGNKIDNIKHLLKAGADVNYLNRSGYNAFVEALTLARYDIALFLLNNGARTDFNDAVALLQAAVISKSSILWPYYKKLIDHYKSKGIEISTPQQN